MADFEKLFFWLFKNMIHSPVTGRSYNGHIGVLNQYSLPGTKTWRGEKHPIEISNTLFRKHNIPNW